MTKNQRFYNSIKALLKRYETAQKGAGLLFPSESDMPIKAYKMHALWKRIYNWKEESNKVSRERLEYFATVYADMLPDAYSNVGFTPGKAERELANLLLSQDNIVSFEYTPLLETTRYWFCGTYFNGRYVGIRVEIINT